MVDLKGELERKMKVEKIGLFISGVLVKEWKRSPENYIESANALLKAVEETYAFHELKLFED